MAQPSELAQLEERRRRLVAESDQCRQQIAREFEQLRHVVGWAEKGYSLAQSLRSWWPAVALAGGFLLTGKRGVSKRGFLLRALGKGWSAWQIAKRLAPLWRRAVDSFLARERGGDPPAL